MNTTLRSLAALATLALVATASVTLADETPANTARPAKDAQAQQGGLSPALLKPVLEAPATTGAEARVAPMTKSERVLFDIREQGRTQVNELLKQIAAAPAGPVRTALEQRVLQVKRDTQVQVLRTISAQATQRGDFAAARQADLALDAMLHPKAPEASAITRQAPGSATDR